jgi:hypothetical protein
MIGFIERISDTPHLADFIERKEHFDGSSKVDAEEMLSVHFGSRARFV